MNRLADEYQQLAQRATLTDVTDRTRLNMSGDDRHSFLHNLCTNDIKKLTPGQGCEAFVTNVQGKCLGFVTVLVQENALLIETVTGQADVLLPHFDRYLITEDVTLADHSKDTFAYLLAGPDAASILNTLGSGDAPAADYQSINAKINGAACTIASVPWLSVPSFLIVGEASDRQVCADGFENSTAPWIDPSTLELARIIAGYPAFGADVTDRNLPQEVDRNDSAISFTKGCYLGQETVARLDALGHVNKQLVRLIIQANGTSTNLPDTNLPDTNLPDTNLPDTGSPITAEGQSVGELTSRAVAPDGSIVAMGFVRCQHATAGTSLKVATYEAIVQG